MTDIYALIEKQRLELETKLAAEVERRDVANRAIKALRAQIDDLPVRKVRRTKRAEVRHKRALEASAVEEQGEIEMTDEDLDLLGEPGR